jgi:hypothetical protein
VRGATAAACGAGFIAVNGPWNIGFTLDASVSTFAFSGAWPCASRAASICSCVAAIGASRAFTAGGRRISVPRLI